MSGYAFGPVIGGAIVTYTSWRVIFWLQTGMSAFSLISIYFFLKETLLPVNRQYHTSELGGTTPRKLVLKLWQWINPLGTIKLYGQRNLLFTVSGLVPSLTVQLLRFLLIAVIVDSRVLGTGVEYVFAADPRTIYS